MTGLLLATAAWAQDASELAEAETCMEARDFAGALAAYDRAIEAAPGDARGHVGRARALHALRRFDDALESVARAIRLAPEADASPLELRALIYVARGASIKALPDLTSAIEIDPGRGRLYRARADVLKEHYDYAGAVRDYSKAYDLDPTDITALERRAQTKELLGDFEGAVADYSLVAATVPHAARPLELRGNALLKVGDAKGAIADYDAALGKDEKSAPARIGRARALLALGEKEAADTDAEKSVRVPARASAFSDRGLYWYDTLRFKEAVADLSAAVKRDPDGQDYARLYLLLARARVGERAEAAAELKAYALIWRGETDWYWRLARFLCGDMKEEDLLHAATRLKVGSYRTEQNDSQSRERECEACWYAGAVRLLDGDAAQAKALFERCVATDVRTFIEYESAKAALAAMK